MKKYALFFLLLMIIQLNVRSQVISLFQEDFSSNSFVNWTFPNGPGNWSMGNLQTPTGGNAPNAYFTWALPLSNYVHAIVSPTIDATAMNGPVMLDYLLQFSPGNHTSLEEFKVEYKDISTALWTLLAYYTNTPTAIQNYSVSNLPLPGMSGQIFQIRFVAYGVHTFGLKGWGLDNINIKGTNCLASIPSISIASSSTVCAGNSILLTALGGGANYTWSPAAPDASAAVFSPTANTTYTVLSALNGCTASPVTAFKTVTVFTNTVPLTLSASTTAICEGNSLTLTATGATSYNWNTGQTSSSISVSPTISAMYSVTNFDGLGCPFTQTLYTIVHPIPGISISANNYSTCPGHPVTLTASGGANYSWSTGTGSSSITASPSASSIYTVIGTDLIGCSSSATVNIHVIPKVTISSAASQICTGGSIILFASGAQSYSWSSGATGSGVTAQPSATTIYTVTGMHSIGCTSTESVLITVIPLPTVTALSSNTSICHGSTATLTASGALNYLWSNSAADSSITVSPATTTTYIVTGNSAGCIGPNSTATVVLNVNPTPTIVASSVSSIICVGNTATLTASGASSYNWSFGSSGQSATITPTTSSTYWVTGTNTLLCSSLATVNVIVNPLPLISISGNTPTCSGDTLTLLASGAQSYLWSQGSTSASQTVNPIVNTSYSVSGTSASNCKGTATVLVMVNPYPDVSISSSDSLICEGESVTLNAGGAHTYSWSNNQSGSFIAITPSVTSTYTLEGTLNGCTTRTTLTQYVDICLGLSDDPEEDAMYSVYPNPTQNMLTVILPLQQRPVLAQVYSITGQLLLSEQLTAIHSQVNMTGAEKGLYYLKITDTGSSKIFKIVKN